MKAKKLDYLKVDIDYFLRTKFCSFIFFPVTFLLFDNSFLLVIKNMSLFCRNVRGKMGRTLELKLFQGAKQTVKIWFIMM